MGTGVFANRIFVAAAFASLAFGHSLAHALPNCTTAIRRAYKLIQFNETHSTEALNLGWDPKNIAEALFEQDPPFLQRMAPPAELNVGQRFKLQLDVESAGRALAAEVKKQESVGYHRQNLEDARAVMHESLEAYLPSLGIELYRKDPTRVYGPQFTIIAINGNHPLNRAARTIFHELGLHVVIGGNYLVQLSDYVQIPGYLFASKKGWQEITESLANIISNTDRMPTLHLAWDESQAARVQNTGGAWRLLNWNELLDKNIRIKRRTAPSAISALPDADVLNLSLPSVQRVHSLEGYLAQLPDDIRSTVKDSFERRLAWGKKPFVYVGVEIDGRWFDIWPTDREPASIDSMKSYLSFFVKDSRFRNGVGATELLQFHVIVGSPQKLEPLSPADTEVFVEVKAHLNSILMPYRKQLPPTAIDFAKLGEWNGKPVIFEPKKPSLYELEERP